MSAHLPGAMEPSSWSSRKHWAQLSVAIWMGDDRVQPRFHRQAQDVVHMSLARERAGVQIVRHEYGIARIDFAPGHGPDRLFQVLPGGTLAKHGVHAEPHFRERILTARGLMAAAHAGGGIRVQLPRRVP